MAAAKEEKKPYEYQGPVDRGGAMTRFGGAKDPDYPEVGFEGFVGVDPIYQNYANDVDAPLGAIEESETTFNTLGEGPDSDEKSARLGGGVEGDEKLALRAPAGPRLGQNKEPSAAPSSDK